jgi:hypothetical protein
LGEEVGGLDVAASFGIETLAVTCEAVIALDDPVMALLELGL